MLHGPHTPVASGQWLEIGTMALCIVPTRVAIPFESESASLRERCAESAVRRAFGGGSAGRCLFPTPGSSSVSVHVHVT